MPSTTRPLVPIVLSLVACSSNPTRVLSPVPAVPGSLACARLLLDERGYDARVSARDSSLLQAERREGQQLGADARRELIEVHLVLEAGRTSLRAAVWAVDYHPAFGSRPLTQNAVVTEPDEETVIDAREVLQRCGGQ